MHSSTGSVKNFMLRYVRPEEDPLETLDPNLSASTAFDRWVRRSTDDRELLQRRSWI